MPGSDNGSDRERLRVLRESLTRVLFYVELRGSVTADELVDLLVRSSNASLAQTEGAALATAWSNVLDSLKDSLEWARDKRAEYRAAGMHEGEIYDEVLKEWLPPGAW